MTVRIRQYDPTDQDAVVALWHACDLVVPWNDPALDIASKVAYQADLFLVGELAGRVVASCMAGYDGHRGWINYLAVEPALQRGALGRQLMDAAERKLRALGCPKINLQVRATNTGVIRFYQRLGFKIDEVTSLGKRLDGR